MLIPLNPAQRATLPKLEKKEDNYFEPEKLEKILEAADSEPIMWRTITYVLAFSGIKRWKLCWLKWSAIDFKNKILHIENKLLYNPYEDTLKTKTSVRDISMPQQVMSCSIGSKSTQQSWRYLSETIGGRLILFLPGTMDCHYLLILWTPGSLIFRYVTDFRTLILTHSGT